MFIGHVTQRSDFNISVLFFLFWKMKRAWQMELIMLPYGYHLIKLLKYLDLRFQDIRNPIKYLNYLAAILYLVQIVSLGSNSKQDYIIFRTITTRCYGMWSITPIRQLKLITVNHLMKYGTELIGWTIKSMIAQLQSLKVNSWHNCQFT